MEMAMVITRKFTCPECGEEHDVTFGEDEDMPQVCTKKTVNPEPSRFLHNLEIWNLTVHKSEERCDYLN
jgi:rRNA maturation protein Nop10